MPSNEFGATMPATGFLDTIKEQIREASGRKCSAPFCRDPLTYYNAGVVILGEIAHIYGHGLGSARSHLLPLGMDPHCYANGISLCRVCHRMIDRCPELFPAELIFLWKAEAENENSVQSRAFPPSMIPPAYDLRAEFPIVSEFLGLFAPFLIFMHDLYYSGNGKNRSTSVLPVSTEVLNSIRAGAMALGQYRNKVPVFFFQHPPFRSWASEIVRGAQAVRTMPEFALLNDTPYWVDFHYQIVVVDSDGTEDLSFSFSTGRAMRELYLQIRRFERYINDLPFHGMPAGLRLGF
ncbi:HNH endonuclease [Pseudomonas coronafaciens]|uniref:HNH endonuclease n=1 Tax=Pseudomonas coronafaciens TaxID=53409 RepID=UPI0011C3F559|nr:HNH endonuclease [Pseudomonas coronafaciens]